MRTTVVDARRDVHAAAYEIVFADGRTITATGEHRFLYRTKTQTSTQWRTVASMRVGAHVRYLTRPWEDSTSRDAWFGGLLDGEGCLHAARSAGAEINVSQVQGLVYDAAREYLRSNAYHVREEPDTHDRPSKYGTQPVDKLCVSRMEEVFRLLGQTRPVRFIQRRWWEGKELPGKRTGTGWAQILAIRPVGKRRMVDLQTAAKTFIAEGFVSHNSTWAESLVAHRLLTRTHTRALAGADVENQAAYLFGMVSRIYDNLPWFLQPARVTHLRGKEMSFSNGSLLATAWGKSTRGELQEVTGRQKGHIGRGKTFSVFHISELSTWDNPGQLDDALFPAVPISPLTLGILESTAKGAGNWWHQHWLAAEEGIGRFRNLFIPWGVEPHKYSLPAPVDWTPSASTLQQARRAETIWPKYIGHTITLTRDQLYFYETTRAYFVKKGDIAKFFEEYASDPEECFLYSGRSVWTIEQLDQIDQLARPLIDVWKVEPARDIAELRRLPPPDPTIQPRDPRPAPPLAPRLPAASTPIGQESFPVPPGYGFRRVWGTDLAQLPNLRDSVLALYEYPRRRGHRRYIMSVDVGDGLGGDYSVIGITRQPTIEEPAEQVATFISNHLTPTQIAFVCDAVGRLYSDDDGIEACAAVECNNHGLSVQDTLQLHLGYTHFYVWEYADSASPDRRYSTRIGWLTTERTRPILLDKFYEATTTRDPISGFPDYRINCPVTRGELRHFLIPDEAGATLGDARAAPGQHDDCVMQAAIGYYVAYRHAGGETEPIAERRRRREALKALHAESAAHRPDWRNTAVSSDDADQGVDHAHDEFDDAAAPAGLHFDPRTSIDIRDY